ncbi:DNA/RNA helicase domain-containing protein [Nocardia sp. NPDC057030]|uniref:DNA/RNA helicase domain-containing protein n=1 Tax=unclassified Nocardia TaxID=2637762 RepID=UPI00363E69C2
MTVHPYHASARELAEFPAQKDLKNVKADDRLSAKIVKARGKKAGPSEMKSWDISVPVLAKLLVETGLAEVEMLIEYELMESDARADVVLAGLHPETGQDSFVVVELKQWSDVEPVLPNDHLVQGPGTYGVRVHPVVQVRGYCDYMLEFVEVVRDRPEALHGVAFLHNATEASAGKLRTHRHSSLGHMFTGDERDAFKEYLRRQFAPKSGAHAAKRLLDSEIHRRDVLIDVITDGLRGGGHYALIDNQRLAYEHVINQVKDVAGEDDKKVIMVTGGPGTGKSMIAAALVIDLKDEYRIRYASGSTTITETMRRYPGKGSKKLQDLFTYYRQFAKARRNGLDVLICDEAHRVRKTSTFQWQKKDDRTGKPQLEELMAAARVPVFFLDENQVIRPDEVGTPQAIRDQATLMGYPVVEIDLDKQFRGRGSAAYREWVLQLVGLRPTKPCPWQGDDFEVRVASSPQDMEDFLRQKNNSGETARITAGYCWPWSKTRPDGTLVADVVLGDWSKPWNKRGDKQDGDAPPSAFWATDPRGFEQVGCIYTAQGLEYDWAGVILGADIVYDGNYLAVRRGCNQDPAFQGRKATDAEFERSVRNIYQVLLTRGMQGVVIHAADHATNEFIADLVGPQGFIGATVEPDPPQSASDGR